MKHYIGKVYDFSHSTFKQVIKELDEAQAVIRAQREQILAQDEIIRILMSRPTEPSSTQHSHSALH